MKPEDFPQFDDPRVREVMAAAANLVEDIYKGRSITISADALKTALFAAQHSKPKDERHVKADDAAMGGCPICKRGLGQFCEKCVP